MSNGIIGISFTAEIPPGKLCLLACGASWLLPVVPLEKPVLQVHSLDSVPARYD